MELMCIGFLAGAVFCLIGVMVTIIFTDKTTSVEETESDFIITELGNLKMILGLSRGDREIIDRAISYIRRLEREINDRN